MLVPQKDGSLTALSDLINVGQLLFGAGLFQEESPRVGTQFSSKDLDFLPAMGEYGQGKGKWATRTVCKGNYRGDVDLQAVLSLGNHIRIVGNWI
jgi:hypothetical protein